MRFEIQPHTAVVRFARRVPHRCPIRSPASAWILAENCRKGAENRIFIGRMPVYIRDAAGAPSR